MSSPESRSGPKVRKLQGVKIEDLDFFLNLGILNPKTKEELDSTLSRLLTSFWKDETGKGFPIIESISFITDINKRLLILLMAAQTLTFALENPAFAADPKNKTSISWAEDAITKIDPMEYLLYKKSERAKASPIYLFDEDDKRVLTLNLYHEIRGGLNDKDGGEESILGVLYSVFERMKDSKYGGDPRSVVLQQSQYSWTLEILSGALNKKIIDKKAYELLKKIVDEYTGLPFGIAHDKLKKRLEELVNLGNNQKKTLPESMNDYHLFNMLSPEKDLNQKYSKHASEETKAKILKAEELYKNGSPLVIKLGRHLHYHSETIGKLIRQKK